MKKYKNPFILWNSYSKENKDLFFGREKIIKQIKQNLKVNHVVLYGPSGAGKSSVCKAALNPDLYFEDYTIDYLKNNFNVKEDDFNSIIDNVKPKHPLIILDQFEKLFYDYSSNIDFIQFIIGQYKKGRINLIITIREENIGDLFRFSQDNGYSLLSDETGVHLRQMERSNIIKVIQKIFQKCNVEISDEKVSLIIDTVEKTTSDIELADIQVVGHEIFKNYIDNLDNLSKDSVFQIIDGFYQKMYKNIGYEEKQLLKTGISSSGERTRIKNPSKYLEPLKKLINMKLIKKVGNNYEITHDYLLKKITENLSKEEISIIKVEELIERAAEDFNYNSDLILDNIRLRNINKFREMLSLDYKETELILKSSLKNDFSRDNKFYWLKQYSNFYPECLEYFISELEEGVVIKSPKEYEKYGLIVEVLKYLYDKNKIEYDGYFEILKFALLSNSSEVIVKAVSALPYINDLSIKVILTVLKTVKYEVKEIIYQSIYNKCGSELVIKELNNWANSEVEENIKTAFDFFKKCKISPEELNLKEIQKGEIGYIDFISYHAVFKELDKNTVKDLINVIFNFDDILRDFALKRLKNNSQELIEHLIKSTSPPFNLLFKNKQNFLDFEGLLIKNNYQTNFISKGSINLKDFGSFIVIYFNSKNPVIGRDEVEIKQGLKLIGKKKRYIINFSNIEISSVEFVVSLLKIISDFNPGSDVFSCSYSENIKKKLKKFENLNSILEVNWYI